MRLLFLCFLPCDALGWSVIVDCDISLSYTLIFHIYQQINSCGDISVSVKYTNSIIIVIHLEMLPFADNVILLDYIIIIFW